MADTIADLDTLLLTRDMTAYIMQCFAMLHRAFAVCDTGTRLPNTVRLHCASVCLAQVKCAPDPGCHLPGPPHP